MKLKEYFDEKVTVVGAGTMGAGIAETFAMSGWRVCLVDISESQLEKASDTIKANVEADVYQNIDFLADLAGVTPSGFVIESVPEKPALKRSVLAEIEVALQPELLCTNSSSLSITELQSALEAPGKFIGLHFFQPVPQTELIEVIHGAQTSKETRELARKCALALGRKPILVRDSPGFATSRLAVMIGLEAMRMFEDGIASAEDIDTGMRLGYGHETGPLRMSDIVGLDVRLAIAEHLHESLGDRFAPPPVLYKMVEEGKLGRKSGQGFYSWN